MTIFLATLPIILFVATLLAIAINDWTVPDDY